MTIDDVLPSWHWRSAHATRVAAPHERCGAATVAERGADLIDPFSGITRREMLAAIKRRAQA